MSTLATGRWALRGTSVVLPVQVEYVPGAAHRGAVRTRRHGASAGWSTIMLHSPGLCGLWIYMAGNPAARMPCWTRFEHECLVGWLVLGTTYQETCEA